MLPRGFFWPWLGAFGLPPSSGLMVQPLGSGRAGDPLPWGMSDRADDAQGVTRAEFQAIQFHQ